MDRPPTVTITVVARKVAHNPTGIAYVFETEGVRRIGGLEIPRSELRRALEDEADRAIERALDAFLVAPGVL